MLDWNREIVTLYHVKKRLAEANEGKRPSWPFHSPNEPATEERLRVAELHLGHRLDDRYRAFLSHADGWQGFFQTVDLFGTSELLCTEHHNKAMEILLSIEDFGRLTGFEMPDFLPIAVSECDIDLFLIANSKSKSPGTVLWLAGGLIETYSSFDEYFLAMVDYNRREIQRFEGKLSADT